MCNCCLLSHNAWHTKVSLPYRANPALSPLSPWEQLRSRINHWDIRYCDSIVSSVLALNNYLLSYSWPSRDSHSTLLHYSLDILSTLKWPWNHIYLLCMSKKFSLHLLLRQSSSENLQYDKFSKFLIMNNPKFTKSCCYSYIAWNNSFENYIHLTFSTGKNWGNTLR